MGYENVRESVYFQNEARPKNGASRSMKTQRRVFAPLVLALGALLINLFVLPRAIAAAFLPTGSLTVARCYPTATLLPNGKVLVTGGAGGEWELSAEVYDPATETWTATGSMSGSLRTARRLHTATLLSNGKVLAAGGGSTSGLLSSTELYDPISEKWTPTGSMSTARWLHTATLLPDGKVLVAGGCGENYPHRLSSTELYDPVAGTWSATGALNTRRDGHTLTVLHNGKVLAAGGHGTNYLSSAELYDPATGTWTETGSMTIARQDHTATLLPNGKVLVAGGHGSGAGSSAELYDPDTGTWTVTGALTASRHVRPTATMLPNGKVLVTGGFGCTNYISSAELYDPITATWTPAGSMTTARWRHTATLLPNGWVLVAGGADTNGRAASCAELYDPAAGTKMATDPLATSRAAHSAALLSHLKLLVAGGQASSDILSSVEPNEPVAGTVAAIILTDAERLPSGAFQFAFTSTPGMSFTVLCTTNLSEPFNGWTALGGVTEISPGQYQFTDPQATNSPQRFYRVRSP